MEWIVVAVGLSGVLLLGDRLFGRRLAAVSMPGPGGGRIAGVKRGTDVRTVMRVILSIAVVGSALYILLSGHFNDDAQKWSTGALGTIIGYWFKGD